ncbi:hypothetical protein F5Y06DRAFT_11706 [Hypoxylon sp. FL0890]|nr:hypothetical protein F5Y06DRAFT_11706 [Hypoxylon sp. FL0890]
MEPLAALGVAAAAVQFFEFSKSLIRDIKAVHDAEKYRPLQAVFARAAKDLTDLNNTFRRRIGFNHDVDKRVSEQEKALDELFFNCNAAAEELISLVEKLKPRFTTLTWTGFQRMMGSRRMIEKIEALEEQITAYQSQLTIRLLAYMDAKFEANAIHHTAELEKLQDNHAKIMEVIAFTQERIIGASINNKNQVLAAMLKLTNGETITIPSDDVPIDLMETRKMQMLTLRTDLPGGQQKASLTDPQDVKWPVLECLTFRHINDRYDTVKKKHGKTFEWIFEPKGYNLPWSPFPQWFESDSPCYWINGKPGSGKTTLMKFIDQAPGMKSLMRNWAVEPRSRPAAVISGILSASFFFWNLGPFSLQKSQSGLLRALLHDILNQAPALIPVVVPELCSEVLQFGRPKSEPSLPELRRWFKRLLRAASPTTKFCFLIDGVDEYVGDFDELVDVLFGETSQYVKFIVSSRPTIPCTEAFSRYPSLRLQDLTRCDIKDYANDAFKEKLGRLNHLVGLEDLLVITEEICLRSSGVFLWVILVVRSLLQGIGNGDSISELLARLRELPTDLAKLYQEIFNSIPTRYRQQATNFFRAMIQSVRYESCEERQYPVTALQMSFIDDINHTANARPKAMSANEISRRHAMIDRRIRSRCCGLLEINTRPIATVTWVPGEIPRRPDSGLRRRSFQNLSYRLPFRQSDLHAPCVEFIHRSVVEFFADTEVLDQRLGDDSVVNDPWMVLFCSHIGVLKNSPSQAVLFDVNDDGKFILVSVKTALLDARSAENLEHPIPPELLDELDTAIGYQWNMATLITLDFPMERVKVDGHWVRMLLFASLGTHWHELGDELIADFDALGFLGVAVLLPLTSYITAWLKAQVNRRAAADVCTRMLHGWARARLQTWISRQKRARYDMKSHLSNNAWKSLTYMLSLSPWAPLNTRLVQLLLEAGADPNSSVGSGPSAFESHLLLTAMHPTRDKATITQMLRLQKLFIDKGATVDKPFQYSAWLNHRCDSQSTMPFAYYETMTASEFISTIEHIHLIDEVDSTRRLNGPRDLSPPPGLRGSVSRKARKIEDIHVLEGFPQPGPASYSEQARYSRKPDYGVVPTASSKNYAPPRLRRTGRLRERCHNGPRTTEIWTQPK